MSNAVEAAEAVGAGRQFVTFQVRDELFGVPLGEVQEIIRVPDLVQVPLGPPSLRGIANLRGAVLPVTSLRRIFGADEVAHDDATRVVVVNHGTGAMGFVVDRMASVVTAEEREIEGAEAIEATVRSELLRGVVKREAGMILLLDPARLVVENGAGRARREGAGHAAAVGFEQAEAAESADEMQLVSFVAAGQEYAFPMQVVREIMQVPASVTHVPQAEPHVMGVITLREQLLPLVSLRRMFGLPEASLDEASRIVVVSAPGGTVGIVTDTVREVLRVGRSVIDPVPALLGAAPGGDGGVEQFEAICRLDGGKRLVGILSAERMFRSEAVEQALAIADAVGEEAVMTASGEVAEAADEEEQFVVFRLAGEEYGVPIDAVQEIVRIPDELTRLPRAAAFMEGVVNLRGAVLPVIDQRRRFALDELERNDRQRIMVLTIAGMRTGFIVDQVSEVLKIPRATIEPAPSLSDEQARLIRRVANLQATRRMILLLDPGTLLDRDEVEAMAAL
jgi:purine-binding chemotaxis protein CheW